MEKEVMILWCAHVRGPDDVVACADYEAAVKFCDKINAVAKTVAHLDVMCIAYPAVWPWDASSHADGLARNNGYRAPANEVCTNA
ncbi:hypothetical protein [Xanthobacter versatilis]|uniref:hypothetical protein n=1 Tax=Xanthobacter autotrophicus (strain ATCC BAA-1158 / Py2) TaxID=78245 RepID=UPI0037284560